MVAAQVTEQYGYDLAFCTLVTEQYGYDLVFWWFHMPNEQGKCPERREMIKPAP